MTTKHQLLFLYSMQNRPITQFSILITQTVLTAVWILHGLFKSTLLKITVMRVLACSPRSNSRGSEPATGKFCLIGHWPVSAEIHEGVLTITRWEMCRGERCVACSCQPQGCRPLTLTSVETDLLLIDTERQKNIHSRVQTSFPLTDFHPSCLF